MHLYEIGNFKDGKAMVHAIHFNVSEDAKSDVHDWLLLDVAPKKPEQRLGLQPILYVKESDHSIFFEYTDAPMMVFTSGNIQTIEQFNENAKTAVEKYATVKDKESVTIEELKELRIKALKEECTKSIYDGFTSDSLGKSFGFNENDQANFTQQKLMVIADVTDAIKSIQWKCLDGTVASITKEQFNVLIGEAATHKLSQQSKYWALESEILGADSVEAIRAIYW